MNQIRADARLAIPVGLSLAVAIAVLMAGVDDNAQTALLAWIVAVGCALFAVLLLLVPAVLPWWGGYLRSLLLLASALSLVLCLLIALRAPVHVAVTPWQAAENPQDEPWFLSWASALRSLLLDHSALLPGVGAQLVPGLAIGDTSRVSSSLTAAMKTSSLTHITAVSGANCAIVTLSVIMLTARVGLSRRWRLALASAALTAFVVLVTPQPSVVRSAVMSIVVIISQFSGRPGSGLPLLAVAAYLMLVWDPWWAVDYGFLLSVLATLGLLIFSGPLTAKLSQWMPSLLAVMVAIPLSAQLLCQPAIVLLSPKLPTYGVLANVLAGPAAPLATIIGLLVVLLLPVLPWLADLLLWLCWVPAEWIGQCAMTVSTFPVPNLPWIAGLWGALLASAFSVLLLVALLAKQKVVRRLAAAFTLIGCLGYLTFGGLSALGIHREVPSDWTIATCDVGQGDAFFIRSENHVALIDVGRYPALMTACMEKLHISTIDLLVLTHYDADHVGGVAAVYGKVVRALVGPSEDTRGDNIVTELGRSGTKVERGTRGVAGTLGNSSWDVVWPSPDHAQMQSGNSGSIVLRWRDAGLSALFLGDLGETAQQTLLEDRVLDTVDVVKVAHHGSADQSAKLYEFLRARVSLVSVGKDNSYGHPTDKILGLLRSLGSVTTRTDHQGLVLVVEHGSDLVLWSERGS